jgi:transcriptional regulator with XRE-family HTH domain
MEPMNRNPEAWKRLGRLLRDAREGQGLSRKGFAEVAGVSEKAVYNAEKGDVPKKQQPPSLVKIAAGHGWRPESIPAILDGGEPVLADEADPAEALRLPSPGLLELFLKVHEFGRACTDLGAPLQARNAFESAAQHLFASVPHEAQAGSRREYGLAAYRPHALGEGVPSDDAEAILRAMEDG